VDEEEDYEDDEDEGDAASSDDDDNNDDDDDHHHTNDATPKIPRNRGIRKEMELQGRIARFRWWATVIAAAFVFLPTPLVVTLLIPYVCFVLLRSSSIARAVM